MTNKLSPTVNPSEPAPQRCDVAGTGGEGYFWQSSFCQSLLDPKPVCLHRVQGRGQPPSQLQRLSKHIVKIIIKWQAIKVCPQALEESEKLLLTAIRRNPNVAALKVLHYYALKQGFERIVIKHCKYVYEDIVQSILLCQAFFNFFLRSHSHCVSAMRSSCFEMFKGSIEERVLADN